MGFSRRKVDNGKRLIRDKDKTILKVKIILMHCRKALKTARFPATCGFT